MSILRRAITLAARRTISEPVAEDAADAARGGGETAPLAMDASGPRNGGKKEERPAAVAD